MDGIELALFLVTIFLGGLVSGFAGFALGLVVSPVWLHLFSPLQTATMIVGCGLFLQGYGTWKLRHALRWPIIWPFIVGGIVGVPIGAMLLTHIDAVYMRDGIGVLLILYSLWGLVRPDVKPITVGPATDLAVGFCNGLLSGLTGLPGIIVTIWCQLRGWRKDVQRAVFQPAMFAALFMSLVSFGFAGALTVPTLKTFALGLPLLLIGAWTGMKLYGKMDEATFRKAILIILLISGIALLLPLSAFS